MLKFRPINIVALILLLCADTNSFAGDGPLEFQGEVNHGDTLVHRFDYQGTPYEFRLIPTGRGWAIWIGEPTHRYHNYVAAVTPPFRGVNPAVIEGWHFRNADNTGPNMPGEDHINAPQKKRHFSFVRDGAGYQKAQESLEILLRPDGHTDAEIETAELHLTTVPRIEGTLWIEALEVGNLVPGERAHIEHMAFRVSLQLP